MMSNSASRNGGANLFFTTFTLTVFPTTFPSLSLIGAPLRRISSRMELERSDGPVVAVCLSISFGKKSEFCLVIRKRQREEMLLNFTVPSDLIYVEEAHLSRTRTEMWSEIP